MKRVSVYRTPMGEWAVFKHTAPDAWECLDTFPTWLEALGYGNRVSATEDALYRW
ncbi:hypothetical protein ACFXG4_03970 [Nocardia sp. NPDC059246]|uniref:hypothetical protein n=1 Tax=unclassified Nocardia TaxID=2637762 RepID=UPI0036B689D5